MGVTEEIGIILLYAVLLGAVALVLFSIADAVISKLADLSGTFEAWGMCLSDGSCPN